MDMAADKNRPSPEQGVAMLSSVLHSSRAVSVNIEIMRAFVRIRQWLASNVELARKLAELEKKYDVQFKAVFDAIRELMRPPAPRLPPSPRGLWRTSWRAGPPEPTRKRIGFKAD